MMRKEKHWIEEVLSDRRFELSDRKVIGQDLQGLLGQRDGLKHAMRLWRCLVVLAWADAFDVAM